jgi:hypothetical protein
LVHLAPLPRLASTVDVRGLTKQWSRRDTSFGLVDTLN